ncbi:MAG TPA: phosphoribosylanthranilate isomerase [Fimbriimonadaceae bacterium]|nr:phosphoribosylanthranilate isomerase [Fimbriimonadaceae bacterium]
MTRPEDVTGAIACGADAIGFVFEPTSPRYIGDRHYSALLKMAGPYVSSVAVFGEANRSVQGATAIQAIRFHRHALAGQHRIQTLRMRVQQPIESIDFESDISAVLLDAYSENEFGGTGIPVDWGYAAELRQHLADREIPMVLAGGLTPENVAEAVAKVRPYAVDVSSGIETAPAVKDLEKVRRFIEAAKSAG